MADIDTSAAAIAALLDGVTDGPWVGFNMTHAEGRPMTPEEIGEYVCNSVKIGKPDQFLFIGAKHDDGGDCDVAHFGNGPRSAANMALCIASRQLVPALAAERDEALARAEQAEARERALIETAEINRKTLLKHNADHAAQIATLQARVAELEGERAIIEDVMPPFVELFSDMCAEYTKDSPELAERLAELRKAFPVRAALSREGGE